MSCSVRATPRSPRRCRRRATIRACPACGSTPASTVTADIARCRARRHHPARDAGAESARRRSPRWRRISPTATPVIACAKGIERGTHKFMTEVIAEAAPACDACDPVGTEFRRRRRARPADRGDAGGEGRDAGERRWCRRWARRPSGPITPRMCAASRSAARPRTCWRSRPASSVGRKLGASALAALTTRGFSELVRLGRACGARSETLAGLSGPRRSDPELLQPAVAQFRARHRARPRRAADRGKLAEGEFTAPVLIELAASQERRYAGIKGGRGDP